MAYVLPQVQVFQEFRVVPTVIVRNLNAFVFGPNYQLFRYAQAAEKELIGIGAYDKDNDVSYAYPNRPAGMAVDQDYVKLYMENIWAQYAAIAAGTATNLIAVSATELNKLRAAPLIGEAKEGGSSIAGIEMDSGGYMTRGVEAVDNYYLWPYGGWDGSAWADDELVMDATDPTQEGKFKYVTTSGLKGVLTLNGATLPYTINGPHGLRMTLNTGVDDELHSPIVCTFSDGGANSVTLRLNEDYIKTIVDWAVDLNKPITLIINITTGGANSVTWSAVNKTVTILSDGGGTPYTLANLKSDLEGNTDVATYFDIESSPDTPAGSVSAVVDQDGNSLDTASTPVVRDCYRTRINPNPYVFKTANGINRSSQFKTRDVQVGDRVRYQVTDGGSVVRTGETKVVGLEADYSVPVVADTDPKSTNAATQVGSNLATGVAYVVAAAGNAREFAGANTKVLSLDGALQKFPGSLKDGVIADSYTLTVTKTGVKGVAEVSVTNTSGTYSRVGVLIENSGADDGAVYIGNNLKINFDKSGGDPDAEFQAGDVYTIDPDVEAPFTELTLADVESGGVYTGPKSTRYVVEVTRGGVFNRAVNVTEGLAVPAVANLSASVDWDDWLGGDVNDEYILRCSSAGDIVTAEFDLTSQLGDDQSGITFGAITTDVALGAKGLVAQFSADDTFDVGDYWVIRVNGCRPQVKISDTAGIDDGGYVTVNDEDVVALGNYGAELTFHANLNTEGGFATGGGLMLGDVFYVVATAEEATAVRTLILADDLPATVIPGVDASTGDSNDAPSTFAAWLYLVQATASIGSKRVQSPPDYNWETDADEITVYEGLQVQDASWREISGDMPWMDVYKATMYVEYRALLTTYSDTIHLLADIGSVETTLGTVTPDNPLAQGVYNALSNSGDRGVYYMAVPTNDLAGYGRVLDAASLTDVVYAFAPTTRDGQILNSVEAHLNSMSSEENKRWRIGFFGSVMPTEVAVYDLATNPAADEFYALVEDDPSVPGDQYTLLRFVDADGDPSPYTQALTDLKAGDKIRINYASDPWGDATYETYTVASVLSNTSLKLTTSLAAPVTVPTKVEAWHPYTVAEMADAVAAESAGYRNRRVYCVFPTQLGAYGVIQTSEFAACAVAGLCSSVVPQQGLTNIEVNGFDDLPMVYSTFSRAQLNTMAENGTLILMQDVAGGTIYVRHQVSTAALDGNINTTELSITKNLDSISYYFASRLQPFIGRYNITPELLNVIETQIDDGLMYLGSFTSVGLLGPQLILTNTKIRSIQQHPTLLDHIIVIVDLQLPYPLNVIELHLVV